MTIVINIECCHTGLLSFRFRVQSYAQTHTLEFTHRHLGIAYTYTHTYLHIYVLYKLYVGSVKSICKFMYYMTMHYPLLHANSKCMTEHVFLVYVFLPSSSERVTLRTKYISAKSNSFRTINLCLGHCHCQTFFEIFVFPFSIQSEWNEERKDTICKFSL